MRKYDLHVAMRPWKTLKGTLVHPKTNQIKKTLRNVSTRFLVPTANKTYVLETGRKLDDRLREHKKECESKTKRAFTRRQHTASLAEINKSALTNHANQENHTINWSEVTVIDREPDRLTRLIMEAIYIRKESAQSMNGDEGSYQTQSCIRLLSWHVKFKFSSCQEPEELVTASTSDDGL